MTDEHRRHEDRLPQRIVKHSVPVASILGSAVVVTLVLFLFGRLDTIAEKVAGVDKSFAVIANEVKHHAERLTSLEDLFFHRDAE
tara:strand:+ start:3777 stop:4031 length:255 start_codon:yes stop_codon:yes gene_type:complete